MSSVLELSTGCRLHFGLLELAEGQPNRYGGLGLMLETPGLRLRWRGAQEPPSSYVSSNLEVMRRVKLAQMHALAALQRDYPTLPQLAQIGLPEVMDGSANNAVLAHNATGSGSLGTIEVVECPPLHSGLGVGTQLATAVAKLTALAIDQIAEHDLSACAADVAGLAALSGRGKRSAIGLHGFQHGGLVRDLGYDAPAAGNNLGWSRAVNTQHVVLPSDWMVVLCCPCASGDVHGQIEDQLIDRAAMRPNPARERMLKLSAEALLLAKNNDFQRFTEALDEYMHLASELFVKVQGGRYRDDRTAERVERLRAAGLCGVGQSSWGPAVFGFASDPQRAQAATSQLQAVVGSESIRVIVTRPKPTGAQWSMTNAEGIQHAS